MESILTSIKKLLGITEADKSFDVDVIMHINSVFMTLNQLGVGPEEGYMITDEMTTWNNFLGDEAEAKAIQAVKIYTYLNVKMLFDPPTSSAALSAMQRESDKLEWRINQQIESNKEE